jgi:hypothetical protein
VYTVEGHYVIICLDCAACARISGKSETRTLTGRPDNAITRLATPSFGTRASEHAERKSFARRIVGGTEHPHRDSNEGSTSHILTRTRHPAETSQQGSEKERFPEKTDCSRRFRHCM